MVISYKKLWKLLIDKDMKKQDLREAAQLSSSTVAKLTHGENVSTAVLLKICTALQCDIADIMEVVPEGVPQKMIAESASTNMFNFEMRTRDEKAKLLQGPVLVLRDLEQDLHTCPTSDLSHRMRRKAGKHFITLGSGKELIQESRMNCRIGIVANINGVYRHVSLSVFVSLRKILVYKTSQNYHLLDAFDQQYMVFQNPPFP